jgi:RHS repeat-associated protein
MNYRTGFSYNTLDYINAFANCNAATSSTFIGNGNDCGSNSAVNTLLVNERLAPNPTRYVARETIVFQGSFTSAATDEFTAVIDNDLGTCTNTVGIAGNSIYGSGNYAMCAFEKPLNDIARYERTPADPCAAVESQSQFIAQFLFRRMRDSLTANFDSLYLSKCLAAKNTEQFYVTYQPGEYHYTLYFYDQAGNLVKTIPPSGVKPNYNASFFADVATKRKAHADAASSNNEALATQYRYNTLNQVIAQQTPDAGLSKFWYDRLGRLAVSQNAQQALSKQYSYTQYDPLGRITEVGQRPQATTMTQTISQNATALQSWLNDNAAGNKEQITLTVYDIPYTALQITATDVAALYQQNLRNRVSYSMLFDNASQQKQLMDGTVIGGNSATYYSYDIHGNVDTLLQDFGNSIDVANAMNSTGNRFKKIAYNYDLISGKVNLVNYQWGQRDQFYHHYTYDEANRIKEVFTSQDSIFWERDASYDFYRHGPLATATLGQNSVQQLDYAYTIQGWLKGVNSNRVGDNYNSYIKDAYGYMLNYFAGDYKAINTISPTAFTNVPPVLPSSTTGASLFNGNISSMLVNIFSAGNSIKPLLYGYRYDQLNRLVAMDAFDYNADHVSTAEGYDVLTAIPDYKERISYDPNGNIKTYLRNGTTQGGTLLAMDNLSYQYEKNSAGLIVSNKLRYVHDQVAATNYPSDLDNQTTNTLAQVQAEKSKGITSDNYQYDAIGNLTKDAKEGIANIQWTVYGKIKNITKTDGTIIKYAYDAAGNRISKTVTAAGVTQATFYVRDATGNTLSVYCSGNAAVNGGHLTQSEVVLYGKDRLGVYNLKTDVETQVVSAVRIFTRSCKSYELTNHLGNVLATVADNFQRSADYPVEPILLTANDYAPFGAPLPGRAFNLGNRSYRYGFNGKENDNDVKGEGNQQDYGMRIYDPRVGRFLSVDPLTKSYPWYTPYQFAGNRPIVAIDLDGAEPLDVNTHETKVDLSPSAADHATASDKTAHGNNIIPWKDLLNFKVPSRVVDAIKGRGGEMVLQNINDATGTNTNFDYYTVQIDKLPLGINSGGELFEKIRKNIGYFLDDQTTFGGYSSSDREKWNSGNPLGSVMSFDASFKDPVFGVNWNLDDASVLTSAYYKNDKGGFWTFSTLSTTGDGYHPISGTRQFGVSTIQGDNGISYLFYIRATDRARGGVEAWLQKTVFSSAEATWKAVCASVAGYVNEYGGEAQQPSQPISKRIPWSEVQKLNK